MEIELARGLKAVIDDEDYPLVSGFKWRVISPRGGSSYAFTIRQKKHFLMHRLITGAGTGQVVDHIDHDTLNNRRENLRVCTHAENMRNSKIRATSRTGVRCVMAEKRSDGVIKYRASVKLDGRRFRKWFSSLEMAREWADMMRKRLHGEFAYSKEQDVRAS
jgi:hypothetical protein